MKLYQFAILWHPNEEEKKEGKKSKIVTPIQTVLSENDKSAMLLAGRLIPEDYLVSIDQLEVALRPF